MAASRDPGRVLIGVGLIFVGAAILLASFAAFAAAALLSSSAGDAIDELEPAWVGDRFEGVIDEQIDSGFADVDLAPDDPLLARRMVVLGHNINARSARDVMMRLLHLNAEDPERPIDLFIATQGGWIDNAFTIIDTMRLIDAPVNTWAVGGCHSAGALILTAGTGRRRATAGSLIMVHTNLTDSDGPYDMGPIVRERYEGVWRDTASLPEEWFPMTSGASYYLGPERARELGIVDEVVARYAPRAAAR